MYAPFTALRALNWSKMAVVKVSTMVNILSNPKVKIIKKNRNDINGGCQGKSEMASGKAMKAKEGPLETTSLTSTPLLWAMKPRMEKTTKPAKTEVKQLPKATMKASL